MHLNTALQCLSAAVVLVFVLYPAWRFRPAPEETLHYQEEHLGPISNLLAPGDSIYVNGAVELLVLLDRPNAVPSIMLDRGKGDFLAAMKYHGSFDSIIEEIESKRPKLVALYRLAHVEHRAELERWTEEHFDKQRVGDYSLYVRRQDQK